MQQDKVTLNSFTTKGKYFLNIFFSQIDSIQKNQWNKFICFYSGYSLLHNIFYTLFLKIKIVNSNLKI